MGTPLTNPLKTVVSVSTFFLLWLIYVHYCDVLLLLDLLPVWKIDGLVGLAACWVYAQPEGGQVARAVNYIPDLARPSNAVGRAAAAGALIVNLV